MSTPPTDRRRFWTVLLLIVLAGLALRVAYVLGAKDGEPMMGDAIYYNHQAAALADGRGFACPDPGTPSCPHPMPVADHPPLTALAMAPAAWLFDRNDTAQRLSMTLLGVAGLLLVGLIGRELAGDRAGWIAAGIAALYPNLWVNDALIMAETLSVLSVAAAVLLAYKFIRRPSMGRGVALGAVCGFGILARAELGFLLPVVVLPVILLARTLVTGQRLRIAAAAVLATAVVVAPWVIPNLFRFEKPVFLSTNDGITISGANCPSVYSGPGLGLWTLDCHGEPKGDQSEVNAVLRRRGLSYMKHHLGRLPVVIMAREGLAWSVFRPRLMVDYNKGEGREAWVSWIGLVVYYLLVPLAVAGGIALRRRGVPLLPLLAQVVIVLITVALFYGLVRFRIPAEITIVVLAAVALDAIVSRTWPPRPDRLPAA
jgi:4-amino-4-deoxy-L-arabinose transferase-like glycosyltransferase